MVRTAKVGRKAEVISMAQEVKLSREDRRAQMESDAVEMTTEARVARVAGKANLKEVARKARLEEVARVVIVEEVDRVVREIPLLLVNDVENQLKMVSSDAPGTNYILFNN